MARILKLHGSTNWLIPHQSINLNTGTMESMCSKLIGKLLVFHGATAPYKPTAIAIGAPIRHSAIATIRLIYLRYAMIPRPGQTASEFFTQ